MTIGAMVESTPRFAAPLDTADVELEIAWLFMVAVVEVLGVVDIVRSSLIMHLNVNLDPSNALSRFHCFHFSNFGDHAQQRIEIHRLKSPRRDS